MRPPSQQGLIYIVPIHELALCMNEPSLRIGADDSQFHTLGVLLMSLELALMLQKRAEKYVQIFRMKKASQKCLA